MKMYNYSLIQKNKNKSLIIGDLNTFLDICKEISLRKKALQINYHQNISPIKGDLNTFLNKCKELVLNRTYNRQKYYINLKN